MTMSTASARGAEGSSYAWAQAIEHHDAQDVQLTLVRVLGDKKDGGSVPKHH
jgi:hypothetical protein